MQESKKPIIKKSIKNPKLLSKAIDDLEIPATDENFWAAADIHVPRKKEMITLRLDPDVIEYFKSYGSGYQTKMNAILKSYVNAQTPTAK